MEDKQTVRILGQGNEEMRRLFIDQYGEVERALTIEELRKKVGGRVSKMYVTRNGKTYHVGYVVGKRWFYCFIPLEKEE